MKICLLICVHFILLYSLKAKSTLVTIDIKVNDEKWILHSLKNFKVSENCLKKSCLAWKVPTSGKMPASNSPWANHPAADFCLKSGGEYLNGTYASGDEDGLCRFQDGSFMLAWDYFKKNSQNKSQP